MPQNFEDPFLFSLQQRSQVSALHTEYLYCYRQLITVGTIALHTVYTLLNCYYNVEICQVWDIFIHV